MAIAFVQASAGATLTGSGPVTQSLTGVANGNSLIALALCGNSAGSPAPALACTDGASYTGAAYLVNSGYYKEANAFYRHGVSAGNYTASVSWSAGVGVAIRGGMILLEVSGLAAAAPDSARGNNSAEPSDGSTKTITSGSTGALTNANSLVLGMAFQVDGPAGGAWALPSGFTNLASFTSAGYNYRFCYQIVNVNTALNLNFGDAANTYFWLASAVAFGQASTGTGAGAYRHMQNLGVY